jgi:ribulose-phosphate 3-epimerase
LSAATKRKKVKIAPSILSADFSRLGDQVREVVKAGADYIHVDVMDGHFVPNISIGIPVVQSLHKITTVPLDVHLMIEEPENYIERFAAAGANIITVHAEACIHLDSTLKAIRKTGAKAGVALNPATPLSVIDEVLPLVDMIVIMTVNPGFGGQEFIYSVVNKLERLAKIIYNRKINAEIEVDGGITVGTSPVAVKAGANVLVAGSAIFSSSLGISKAFKELRNSIC